MQDQILLKHQHSRVPRYTSYPTAPHFTPHVDESMYRAWLGGLSRGGALSLYLHVPFCHERCWYCGCNTQATQKYGPIATYLTSLLKEIDLLAEALPRRMRVQHIHWGGGTPNALDPDDFRAVMGRLGERFEIASQADIAVEIDPRCISTAFVAALAEARVSRVSLGVQSFDPTVQRAINRVQSVAQTRAAADAARAAGVRFVNMDLLYGLPHQTVAMCHETVDRALEIGADRLAIFGYAHMPSVLRNQGLIDESALPGPAERLQQAETLAERLVAAGYVAIGLDHFARPDDPLAIAYERGMLHRNFQGYTEDRCETLLGLGASAIGSLPPGYVQNEVDTVAYAKRVAAGALPIARGRWISKTDRVRRQVIQDLMSYLRVDLQAVASSYGVELSFFRHDLDALHPFEADGLIRVDGGRVTVADEARPLVRTIASVFDTYLRPEEGRHARAI
ncbi:MAG: oxygen-independent coproporphyrinogen III oxidase [Alphaproteobacteria bacterium]|jgi:oxygen-independent coproporphyrinogen-3 oxidase|nr:oxygen-independent coproporphyrinogen III oxidase [Alphaproteobacteria bacterium]